MVARCSTFEVSLALKPCLAPLQEAVALPARRLAHQSIVDVTALYLYATPQRPTGLYSLQPLRSDASGALARALRLPNSSLAALYPHWHLLQARPRPLLARKVDVSECELSGDVLMLEAPLKVAA
jgi:hypothetical protein